MTLFSSTTIRVLLTCSALALPLAACSGSSEPVSLDEQAKNLKEDISALFWGQEKIEKPIGLYEAMARGIKYNLSGRVSAAEEVIANGQISLEQIKALPALNLDGTATGRDNHEVLSARDAALGTPSVPPSIFYDRYRRVASFDASWNLLDAGLAFAHSRDASNQARAALERRRHVIQNMTQEIRYAYWRAVSSQILDAKIADLMARTNDLNRRLEDEENKKSNADNGPLLTLQKHLYDSLQDLLAEKRELSTAKAELAGLINIPPGEDFTLDAKEADMMSAGALPKLSADPKDLDILALLIRPEMREQALMTRIAAAGPNTAVLETFPGLSAMLGTQYDSNGFLSDHYWQAGAVNITDNLMKLFTLPVRLEQAQNRQKLADMQRMAMVASVLTQMRISTIRYNDAKEDYALLKKEMGVNQRLSAYYAEHKNDNPLLAEGALLNAEIDQLLTRTRLHLAYAEGQNAFGRVVGTIGLDPLPPGLEGKSVPELSALLKTRLSNLDGEVISALLSAVKEKTDLLQPSGPVKSAIHPASAAAQIAPNPVKADNNT